MSSTEKSIGIKGLAVSTAMAGALLSGCSATTSPLATASANSGESGVAQAQHAAAIAQAETNVLAEPRNAELRSSLGRAYLDAGRFASAQTSYDDAIMLGDNSPRTALSLSLALTAQAKYAESAALLGDWEGQIAPADLGLALALSGQPERGIHIMTNAIRGGNNTVKMRQNLAYAYAVAGRWREARIMVSQDVPAGEVGGRMEQWAAMVHPNAYQLRVARLLNVPAGVQDQGQPYMLALTNHPESTPMMAESSPVVEAEVEVAAAPVVEAPMVEAPIVEAEIPAVVEAETVSIPVSAGELPSVGQPTMAAADAPQSADAQDVVMSQGFTPQVASEESAPRVAQDAIQFVSRPVVQAIPGVSDEEAQAITHETRASTSVASAEPVEAAPAVAAAEPVEAAPSAATMAAAEQVESGPELEADHLVQLGSFSSEASAERAWNIYVSRYPDLADHEKVITQAVVNGRNFWRVSAAGFSQSESTSMCAGSSANAGEGCIAWAESSPLPGAINRAPTGIMLASR